MSEQTGKCHICGKDTEIVCRKCGEHVCENCTVSYDQFSQIDFDLCESCYDSCHDFD